MEKSNMNIMSMFQELSKITNASVWGKYAYSRELMQWKISERDKQETIEQAKRCGIEYAEKLLAEYEGWQLTDIVSHLGLLVEDKQYDFVGDQIIFAKFTTPNEIEIMHDTIDAYHKLVEDLDAIEVMPSKTEVYDLLLAHELFHWIEEEQKEIIYTRTKKIKLWGIWKYSYETSIHALGEIAAMYFSQCINRKTYSPFVLDVLLSYSYSEDMANKIYKDVLMLE